MLPLHYCQYAAQSLCEATREHAEGRCEGRAGNMIRIWRVRVHGRAQQRMRAVLRSVAGRANNECECECHGMCYIVIVVRLRPRGTRPDPKTLE